MLVLHHHGIARNRAADRAASLVNLQSLRLAHRDAQAEREIVRDVVAADAEHSALLHCAARIHDEARRAAADVHHDCARGLLVRIEHRLRCGVRGEDDVLDLDVEIDHALEAVADARGDAMHDVKVRLQLAPVHADGVQNSVLPVHVVVLENRVDEHVLRRDRRRSRRLLHSGKIAAVNLLALLRQRERAPVVIALDVPARDAEIDVLNHHVALLLRVRERLADALAASLDVHDLALANAARRRLAHTEDLDRPVAFQLRGDRAHLRGADFKPDDNLIFGHQIRRCGNV